MKLLTPQSPRYREVLSRRLALKLQREYIEVPLSDHELEETENKWLFVSNKVRAAYGLPSEKPQYLTK